MKSTIQYLLQHQTLSREESCTLLKEIAAEQHNEAHVTAFISVFMMRDISVQELSGFRDALLELCIPVDFSEYDTIDIVGTGGDSKNTFNISTMSSLVVSAAGYNVAKHGSTGVSSACGSSNVIEALGYQFTNDNAELRRRMEKDALVFMHAPLFHPAMKVVAPIRKALGLKTIFNMLGPLVNPSLPKNMMLGVSNLEIARLYEYLLQESNTNFSIVHSLDGYDEVSLTGDFKVITPTKSQVFSPEMLNLHTHDSESLFGGDSVAAATKLFEKIICGEGTQAQNEVVIANSALAIQCLDPSKELGACIEEAERSLIDGLAKRKLEAILK